MASLQHPVQLWDDADFMERVRVIVAEKWIEAPDHCPSLCSHMAQAQALAHEHVIAGADPHHLYFLTMAHLFALGWEAALLNLATREHES